MEFYIYVRNKPVIVPEEVYRAYESMRRRERYLRTKDRDNGKVLYSNFDTEETLGEEMIPSSHISNPVEQEVLDRLLKTKLYESIARLDSFEQMLIGALYFEKKTQMQLSKETGMPQRTISYRLHKALKKLRVMIDE